MDVFHDGRLAGRTKSVPSGFWSIQARAPQVGSEVIVRISKVKSKDKVICSDASARGTVE